MSRVFLPILFVLMVMGCAEDQSSSIANGPPDGPPGFEEGTGTVVLSGRIN